MRAFLVSPETYRSILLDRDNLLQSLKGRAEKTTTSISGMPTGGGTDRNALLASLVDAELWVAYWESKYNDKRRSVMDFLSEIPMQELGDIRKTILWSRYVKRMKWADIFLQVNDIKKKAGEKTISIRQVYYEHVRALNDCANWLNKPGIIKYRSEVLNS